MSTTTQLPNTLIVVPAYGADYRSKVDVMSAWRNGQDFKINTMAAGSEDGRYCSSKDAKDMKARGVRWINIRYKRQTAVMVIDLEKERFST